MRLKDFLQEEYRSDITLEKAQELLKIHCKDADIEHPCWRGSKEASKDFYIIHGEKGKRSSANSLGNYYKLFVNLV